MSARRFIIVLSLGSFLYQAFKICQLYFSYETVISMSYPNQSLISLPAITFCIANDKLIKNVSHSSMFYNMTAEERLSLMNSWSEMLKLCSVSKPVGIANTTDQVECRNVSPILTSTSVVSTCLTLFHQEWGESDERFEIPHDLFGDNSINFLHIFFDLQIRSVHIWFHPRKQLIIRQPITSGLEYHQMKDYCLSVQYNKRVYESMQYPYQTNCFDYQNKRLTSREDCVQKCRIRHMTRLVKGWPGYYLLYNITNVTFYDTWSEYKRERPYNLDSHLGKLCKEECDLGTECRIERFRLSTSFYPYPGMPHFMLFFLLPDTPDLLIKQSPKMIFEEFVSYIGSLLGLLFWILYRYDDRCLCSGT